VCSWRTYSRTFAIVSPCTTTRMASMLMRSRPGWMCRECRSFHRTGIFHPKNVFALVEESVARRYRLSCPVAHRGLHVGEPNRAAGWWENVEVCHIETSLPQLTSGCDLTHSNSSGAQGL